MTAAGRLSPALRAYLEGRVSEENQIPQPRRAMLLALAEYAARRLQAGQVCRLLFICTHNSRRSHLAQAAGLAAAEFAGLSGVETFSGGTEVTAFFPRAVNALRQAGFAIDVSEPGSNPRYNVRLSDDAPGTMFFSKRFDDPTNPKGEFAAIMTCTDADEACPLVPGCDVRIRLPYDDPKLFDQTTEADEKYAERLREIARELVFAMRAAAGKLDG